LIRYKLRFAILNTDKLEGQKWLNEIKYEKYKQLGDNESSDTSSNSSVSSKLCESTETLHQNATFNEQEQNRADALFGDCVILAINTHRKQFLVFNFLIESVRNGESAEKQTEDELGDYSTTVGHKFYDELLIWLDKLTEGLCQEMKTFDLKKWPTYA
jgi:hypothetical protein